MNNKIILYLDGQMNREERAAFETELERSQALSDELKKMKNFNAGISELKNIPAREDYFVQMIPKFRGKHEQKRKFNLFPGIAYSVTTATAVIIVMLFVMNKNVKNEAQPFQNNVETQQLVNFEPAQDAVPLSDQFGFVNMSREEIANSDSLLNSMLVRELNLTSQSLSDISTADNNTADIQTILQGVNDKEADAIYNEILHKKIL
jgi:hypothetical protein